MIGECDEVGDDFVWCVVVDVFGFGGVGEVVLVGGDDIMVVGEVGGDVCLGVV